MSRSIPNSSPRVPPPVELDLRAGGRDRRGEPGESEAPADPRERFLAMVSHELRTPLAGVQSWAHVLERAVRERVEMVDDALILRAMSGIQAGVARQVELVEMLLDATRVVTHQVRLSRTRFALHEAVDSALAAAMAQAAVKQIELRARRADPDVRTNPTPADINAVGTDRVDADFDRIEQIAAHLIENAVKFTPPHGIVEVEVGEEAPSERFPAGAVKLEVADTGPGISDAFMARAFEPFTQADASDQRAYDGLGLGLMLVQHLVQMHGGTVSVARQGTLGGAVFVVRLPRVPTEPLPASVASAATPSVDQEPSLRGMSVMVIDDQAEARESLSAVLEQSGAEVLCAGSCREALRLLDSRGAAHEPHVLICDIAMPEDDGFTTLGKIRAWEHDSGVAPADGVTAIALSAYAQREDRLRALARGFMLYFAKPVDPPRLLRALASVVGKSHPGLLCGT